MYSTIEPYEKCYPEFVDLCGIRRIALKDSALVEIVRVESPSSIFVRPINHIASKLTYREPYQMTPIANFSAGNYALAPLEDRVFGRSMIIRNLPLLEACRVFFIDEAITANVSWKCLFQIDESQKFDPWQVMHVTLGRMSSLTDSWSHSQCETFKQVVSEFSKFQITPCQVDLINSSDRPSLLVNLYGIPCLKLAEKTENRKAELTRKVAIEDICGAVMKDVHVSVFPTLKNLMENPKITDLDAHQDNLDVILLEQFRRKLPNDWIHESQTTNYTNQPDDWDLALCQLSEWNSDSIRKFIKDDGCFWAFLLPDSVVSPWEMHIIPIMGPEEESRMDNEQWIFDQFDKIADFQVILNDFYSNLKNQRPLEAEEIKSSLAVRRTYAMASIQNRTKCDAQWLRCEILSTLPNANVEVRYVDHGTRGFQKIKNLHRIHRIHTHTVPFSLEISRFSDENFPIPPTEIEWNNRHWREIVPYDVPIVVGPEMAFSETGKLYFTQIRLIGEEENLMEQIPAPSSLTERTDDSSTEEEGTAEEDDNKRRDSDSDDALFSA